MVQQNWHSMENEEVLFGIGCESERIEPNQKSTSVCQKYGPNQLEQPEPTSAFFEIFISIQ